MPASKAQQKAVAKYMRNNYDTIITRVPKGTREKLQEYCKSKNISVNKLINDFIENLPLN